MLSFFVFFPVVDDEAPPPEAPSPEGSEHNLFPPRSPPHPHHRAIRDINEWADFSSFEYSADVAHLFKENRHSERTDPLNFRYTHLDGKSADTLSENRNTLKTIIYVKQILLFKVVTASYKNLVKQ